MFVTNDLGSSNQIKGNAKAMTTTEYTLVPKFLCVPLLLLVTTMPAFAGKDRTVSKLADGIFVIQHQDSPAIAGNTTIIIDLGNREVQVKFLGRGNTGGDAVVYLPKEKVVITGDLVAAPTPNTLDGYPEEWIGTLRALQKLQPATIVPGHGAVMHDQVY